MKCPACKTPDLLMTERQGVEIDYCPQCRGVWLDRGELDKILERTGREAASAPHSTPTPAPGAYGGRKPDDSDVYPAQGGTYSQHRKKHWLSELFD